ncbi:hypothetical protein Y032_0067g100 [Ancylostoma ceylanicum]|uniref:Uncharacterized protein n=1 Tax=Ancylostoma ceylanicum TaxID=53326 RepID=A0A016U0E7_9BILA|nr:hypothetical protein Y032_0067g100 [Ancylostoma ceylanicum]
MKFVVLLAFAVVAVAFAKPNSKRSSESSSEENENLITSTMGIIMAIITDTVLLQLQPQRRASTLLRNLMEAPRVLFLCSEHS